MPKRRHILILFACGAMVVIALAFLARPHEPSYKGKSLSQWLESYDPEDLTASAPATEAIHHIGTKALPYLLKWITYETPPWKAKLRDAFEKSPPWLQAESIYEFLGREATRASQAQEAFAVLGSEAKEAIPELIRRFISFEDAPSAGIALAHIGSEALPALMAVQTNQDREVRGSAASIIRTMGSNARPAVPLLIQCLRDEQIEVAAGAAVALGQLHLEPDLVVPALTASLQDDRWDVRKHIADALGEFGREALPAVPALLQTLNDPDEMVRITATNALLQIDPQALTNAPVQ